LAKLIFHGKWRDIVFCGRWCALWQDWPPQEWLEPRLGRNAEVKLDAPLPDFNALLHGLRRWAPLIIGDGEHIDPDHADAFMLDRHISILECYANSKGSSTSSHMGRGESIRYTGAYLTRVVMAAEGLRTKATLGDYIEHKIIPLVPIAFRQTLASAIADGSWKIPSWSSRLRLVYDSAITLWRRKNIELVPPGVCFGFSDSSEQGHRDWFITRYRMVSLEDLDKTVNAVFALAESQVHGDVGGDDEAEDEGHRTVEDEPLLSWPSVVNRADLFANLKTYFLIFTCLPVAMMHGKTALEHKVAAFLYQLWMEFGQKLVELLDVFASYTTDMGAPPLSG
jgi:hypothetical protein